jgi:hypothetical protein
MLRVKSWGERGVGVICSGAQHTIRIMLVGTVGLHALQEGRAERSLSAGMDGVMLAILVLGFRVLAVWQRRDLARCARDVAAAQHETVVFAMRFERTWRRCSLVNQHNYLRLPLQHGDILYIAHPVHLPHGWGEEG